MKGIILFVICLSLTGLALAQTLPPGYYTFACQMEECPHTPAISCPVSCDAYADCTTCILCCGCGQDGCPYFGYGGIVQGDPHFTGFQGEKFEVDGEPSKVFNLLSDKRIQLNAFFTPPCGGWKSFMGAFGLKIGSHRITFNKTGTFLEEEELLGEVKLVDPPATIQKFNHTLVILAEGYYMKFERMFNVYRCRHVDLAAVNVISKSLVNPHGLLGQTYHHNHTNAVNLHSHQGEGEIEGTYRDYKVSHLFADDFKFNRYTN